MPYFITWPKMAGVNENMLEKETESRPDYQCMYISINNRYK